MRKGFWKKAVAVIASAGLAAFVLAGCSSNASSSNTSAPASASGDSVIKVGASPTPHAEILGAIQDDLAQQGYTLDIVEYNDYVLPNTALESGEIDANYFQHITYLNDFNAENGTDLVPVAEVHFEPFGLYSQKIKSLDDLAEGAVVAVPNDTTNEARALLLLQQVGLIDLNPDAGLTATVVDITSNPKNLQIQEVEAAQIPRVLQDVDLAAINGNYALDAGFNVNTDSLAVESTEGDAASAYANVLAVKAGNENDAKTKALCDALLSPTVKQFIEENYQGAVVAVFE